jgi:hypothetical protein
MKNYNTFKESISQEQAISQLVKHFNEIYRMQCFLSEHEYKIAYLAYLWKHGKVVSDNGFFDVEKGLGVSIMDFELTFEIEQSGGVNLDLTRDYYQIDKLIKLV